MPATCCIKLIGVDLCAIDGLNETTVQTIIGETGADLTAFPSEKYFCFWLGLAPHNDMSGGKVLRSKTLKTANRAGQAFRLAAQAVARSPQTTFGAFYRRMRSRAGAKQAIVATAHKITRVFCHMLKHRVPYHDLGGEEYERRARERELHNLERRLQAGHDTQPVDSGGNLTAVSGKTLRLAVLHFLRSIPRVSVTNPHLAFHGSAGAYGSAGTAPFT